ncbi:MAG: AsmA family protein, partial [Pseudomonadota bacterium]
MRHRIRPLPLLLATFAGLLLVVGLRLVLVVGSLQPAELAARLREEARARTGHDLTVEGLEMDLLPRPTVTLTGLVLGPAPGFGPEPLAQAARVQATFRLLPLLRRRLEVGAVQVDGLRIELERGPTGRGSWETLREHLGGLRGEGQEGARDLPALRIGDAHLRYRDLGGGREVEIDGLALRFGRAVGQGTRALAVEGALRSVEPRADGHIAASARMLAPPGALVQLQEMRLDATLATGGRSLTLHAAGPVELDTTRARLSAPALALHLEASGEGLPAASVAADLAGLLRADLQDGRLWLEELSVDAAGLRATGALTVAGLPAAPTVEGRLALSRQDLGAALAALGHPLSLAGPAALAQVSATLPFRWAAGALEVDDLDLRLGEARIRGDLTARSLQPPDLRFELDATALDLDGLRPVGDGDGSAWPPAGLAAAHVAGRLRGHDLRLGGVTLAYLDLPLELQGGRLQVAKARVTALSGGLNLDLDADLVGVDGRQHLEAELVTLDLARALEALGSERGLSGTAQAHGELWATGRSAEDLRGSLSGELCIALVEGVIPLERGGEDA